MVSNIIMEIKFKTHLAGTKQRYFVISLWNNGECVRCATSKSLSYIRKIRENYEARIRALNSPTAFLEA